MNIGPYIDPPEVLVHCNLTQVHTPRVSFIRTTTRHTGVLSCVVLKRTLEFGTTEKMLPSYLDEHMWRERCGQTAKLAMLNVQRHSLWPSAVNHYKSTACYCGRRLRTALLHWSMRAGQSPLRVGLLGAFRTHSPAAIAARGISTK